MNRERAPGLSPVPMKAASPLLFARYHLMGSPGSDEFTGSSHDRKTH